VIEKALEQSSNYLERLHSELKEGHIIIFDRDSSKPWDEKIYQLDREYKGYDFKIWGMRHTHIPHEYLIVCLLWFLWFLFILVIVKSNKNCFIL